MGLHVYCIVPAGHAPDDSLRGVEGVPVRLVGAAGLGIWTSPHAEPPAATLESVRAHNEVARAAMDDIVTPVPVRFGQWFASEGALPDRIAGDADRWSTLLQRFAGRAEYGVTIVAPDQAARDVRPDPGSTGTAFMQHLALKQADATARRQRAEDLAQDIAARLSSIDVESTLETAARGPVLARLAHLVAWRDGEAYHAAMREVARLQQHVQVHLTGPWPPWSFT